MFHFGLLLVYITYSKIASGFSTIYVALFPCNECAKAIIQSGIKEVVYLSDKYAESPATLASKRMLASAGVTIRRIETSIKEISLDFNV